MYDQEPSRILKNDIDWKLLRPGCQNTERVDTTCTYGFCSSTVPETLSLDHNSQVRNPNPLDSSLYKASAVPSTSQEHEPDFPPAAFAVVLFLRQGLWVQVCGLALGPRFTVDVGIRRNFGNEQLPKSCQNVKQG